MSNYFRKKAEQFCDSVESEGRIKIHSPEIFIRRIESAMKEVARDQRHACHDSACSDCAGYVFNANPKE